MLQGKPLLPPAAVPGITARLPGNLLGFGFRMPEDAVLLRSSFPKTPLTGKKGFKWLKLGVWVKEKKSLKWYNEQWVGLEGLFLLENRFFFLGMTLNSVAHKEGLGSGKGDPGGLSRIDRKKRRAGNALCPPGREPASRRPGNTSCFCHCHLPRFPAVHFLFHAPFKTAVDAGGRRAETWKGVYVGGV